MRQETIIRNIYTFAELPEDVKAKVLEKQYNLNVDGDYWFETVYEDAEIIAEKIGIEFNQKSPGVPAIYFSGFSSQGDGACFEGNYSYAKNSVKAVKDYAPKDAELHRIVMELFEIQKRHRYGISANIEQSGHYSHSGCTLFAVEDINGNDISDVDETAIIRLLRDFMDWIYKQLNDNYDYLTSNEAIIETIEANEYEFTLNGEMA